MLNQRGIVSKDDLCSSLLLPVTCCENVKDSAGAVAGIHALGRYTDSCE